MRTKLHLPSFHVTLSFHIWCYHVDQVTPGQDAVIRKREIISTFVYLILIHLLSLCCIVEWMYYYLLNGCIKFHFVESNIHFYVPVQTYWKKNEQFSTLVTDCKECCIYLKPSYETLQISYGKCPSVEWHAIFYSGISWWVDQKSEKLMVSSCKIIMFSLFTNASLCVTVSFRILFLSQTWHWYKSANISGPGRLFCMACYWKQDIYEYAIFI